MSWNDIVDDPKNVEFFEHIPESEKYNKHYEGYENLNMNSGDLISFEQSPSLKINDVELNPEVIYEKEKSNQTIQSDQNKFSEPIDLGKSENPASDLINRTTKVLENGGEIGDIIKPGTSIDEGAIDIWENFGGNYFQRDQAYGGTFEGIPVMITTFGKPKDPEISHVSPFLIKSKNEKYPYALRLQNDNNEELLEFRFRNYGEFKKVYNKFSVYDSRKK